MTRTQQNKRWLGSLVVLLLTSLTNVSVFAQSATVAPPPSVVEILLEQFRRFESLQQTNNPALADLYADNAKIRAVRNYADGQTRHTDWLGERWKLVVRSVAASRKHSPDIEISNFTNVRMESLAENLVMLRAHRFSTAKCFEDPTYYQIWGKSSKGAWLIVQEFTTTIPVSYCQPSARNKR